MLVWIITLRMIYFYFHPFVLKQTEGHLTQCMLLFAQAETEILSTSYKTRQFQNLTLKQTLTVGSLFLLYSSLKHSNFKFLNIEVAISKMVIISMFVLSSTQSIICAV